MTIAVVRFPATNNESDILNVFNNVLNSKAILIPHFEYEQLYDKSINGIFIPGGFSYGDYIRPGAIAAVSDIMKAVKTRNEEDNVPVMGICNGFQILTEAKMLPGVLLKNISIRFISKWIYMKRPEKLNPFTIKIPNLKLKLPIAHFEGRYWIDKTSLKQLEENSQIIGHYCNEDGAVTSESNPNGSLLNIAGVTNENFTVFGLMPHPERASRRILSSSDGLFLLKSFLNIIENYKTPTINLIG